MIFNDYDLEIDGVISTINKNNYKKILLQFPDGLKQFSNKIKDKIQENTEAKIIIWAGSNFGSCDIPLEVEKLGFDTIVHFGHSKWRA